MSWILLSEPPIAHRVRLPNTTSVTSQPLGCGGGLTPLPSPFWNSLGCQRAEPWNLFWVHRLLLFTGEISPLDWEAHGTLMAGLLLTSEGELSRFLGRWLIVTLEGRHQGAKCVEDFGREERCKGSRVPLWGCLHFLHLRACAGIECSCVCTPWSSPPSSHASPMTAILALMHRCYFLPSSFLHCMMNSSAYW